MLYEHLGAVVVPSVRYIDRDEWGAPGLGNLGAVVPHAANVYITVGGSNAGHIGLLGVGGGAPPGDGGGGTNVSAAITGGSGFHPVGRFTSPFTGSGQKGKAALASRRGLYQSSKQGARAGYPVGSGLSGADPSDVGGLGFSFSWSGFIQPFTNPAAYFKRVSTVNPVLRNFDRSTGMIFTKAARVGAATAVGVGSGAATGFLAGGPVGAIIGGVGGGAYGMSKGIMAQIDNAPTGRTLYQTILPSMGIGAIAGYLQPFASLISAPQIATPGSASFLAPVAPSLSPAYTAANPALYATPSTFTTIGSASAPTSLTQGSLLAQAGAPSFVAWSNPAVMAPVASQLPGYLTPAQAALNFAGSPGVVAPSADAAKDSLAMSALKYGGKSLFDVSLATVASIATKGLASAGMSKASPQAPAGGSGGQSATAPQNYAAPGVSPVVIPSGGGGVTSAGDSSGPAPILAGSTLPMLLVLGGVGVTLAVKVFKKKRGKK